MRESLTVLYHQDIEDALPSRTRMLVLTAHMPDNWVSIHHTTRGQLVHYSVGLSRNGIPSSPVAFFVYSVYRPEQYGISYQ